MKGPFTRNRELESVKKARQKLGMKPLDKVKGEHYKSYLQDCEKRRYSAELLIFRLDK